jgi:hypothetical protein
MFFTPEYSFRKLHPNRMPFSRTGFSSDATDGRWVTLKRSTRAKEYIQGAHRRSMTMFRKLTLALVAAASLGAMALAPTAASAGGGGGWGGGWHHHHHGFGIGFIGGGYGGYEGCYQVRRVPTPYGYRFRTVNVCAY